ncbi:DUF5050 domain-containing protein [Paenibacillus planticolens]|uniref:DUF5050 domain-containing protein n=1 Tax=Paenibacillus planticolens TaxID=2654976 RepID=A0ABX1ZFF4_9BACL|nr:DUF5050 domain-containing protein [Paenibacillus planticolens]NOU98823.1 DUF5050 domain-containing protein [Paenibacillus planticolens]
MKKKWAVFALIGPLSLAMLAQAGQAHANASDVRVVIPEFKVKLNGHLVENAYREYPLLVFKDITYFPMTWYDSRLLGLEASWAKQEGLRISQGLVASDYAAYKSDHRNAASYRAEVPASAITVNGQTIDNAKEEYPLLSFRDVTYFPLTWRFAHDQFSWDYKWDPADGLSIQSHNPQMQSVGLPAYAGENDVALFKGYYYFVQTTETTNHVYRAPVQKPSDKEEIYAYNIKTSEGLQKQLTFQIRGNTLWFTYHLGGGIMGHDEFVQIGDDGKAELLHQGYLDFRDTPYGTLIISLGASAFEGGNLYLSPSGHDGTNGKSIGDPDLKYAVTFNVTSSGVRNDTATSLAVRGDDVFVLASRSSSDANHIYKISLKTNKTDKIVNSSVSGFRVIDNKLYYVKDEDNALYSSTLDGTGEMKLSDHAVSWFGSIDSHAYYTSKNETNHFDLYQADPKGEDPRVWTTPVAEVQVLNKKLVCRLGENEDYGVVVLDGSGRLLLKVAEPVARILTSDDGILVAASGGNGIQTISLTDK